MAINPNEYTSLSQRDHIYLNGDTELGGTEQFAREEWCFVDGKIIKFKVTLPPACERIFLEILSNACDNVIRSRSKGVSSEKINITMNEQWISICNDGIPLTVAQNAEGMWIPNFVFGKLRTSSNYDRNKERITAGKNGYGAKLTNIFSLDFNVHIVDNYQHLEYYQQWKNNMREVSEPVIVPFQEERKSLTQISYHMDFARFAYQKYPPEAFAMFAAHAAMSALANRVTIQFNSQIFSFQDPIHFAEMCCSPEAPPYVFMDDKTTCLLAYTPYRSLQMSFVNGIPTREGGTHLDAVYNSLAKPLLSKMNEKLEKANKFRPAILRQHITVILSCHGVANPAFSGQTKNKMISPKITLCWNLQDVIRTVSSWKITEQLSKELKLREEILFKKTDGKKTRDVNVKKLEHDANFAGGKKSQYCTLLIVEGQSACKYAETFLKILDQVPDNIGQGHNYLGIYAIQGKLLNVLNSSNERISKNNELVELKKVLGLRQGVDYRLDENYATLRYGKIAVLADSDVDGKHIIGLITLMFNQMYPGLIDRNIFYFLRTPIIRVQRGNTNISFLTEHDYLQWAVQNNPKEWTHHYFKGLASSTDQNIAEDAGRIHALQIAMIRDPQTDQKLRLAFDRHLSKARKEWLARGNVQPINSQETTLPISTFVDTELYQHALTNLERSIPKFDGLKNSQRKILWTAMHDWRAQSSRNRKKKTVHLANRTSEFTNYHYGENSLVDAINAMVFSYPGTNNMPYFLPESQCGTRENKKVPQARYTYVKPNWWWDYVFRPEDLPILNIIEDEGQQIEPLILLPVIPMGLVNGGLGVGTGYSTFIPNHNPLDIIAWLRARLTKQSLPQIMPWYKNFRGTISVYEKEIRPEKIPPIQDIQDIPEEETEEEIRDVNMGDVRITTEGKIIRKTMLVQGQYSIKEGRGNSVTFVISEIPIGMFMKQYEDYLKSLIPKKILSNVQYHGDKHGQGFFTFSTTNQTLLKENKSAMKILHLQQRFGISNLVLLNEQARPLCFSSIDELLETWAQWRYPYYQKRWDNLNCQYQQKQSEMEMRLRFLRAVISGQLVVTNRPNEQIKVDMDKMGFPFKLLDDNKIRHITQNKITELEEKLHKLYEEHRIFLQKTAIELWLDDLLELETAYEKHRS